MSKPNNIVDNQKNTSWFAYGSQLSLALRFSLSVAMFLLLAFAVIVFEMREIADTTHTFVVDTLKAELGESPETDALAEKVFAEFSSITWTLSGTLLVLFVGVVVMVYFLFVKLVRNRINLLAKRFIEIVDGNGDLTQRVEIRHNDSIDRLGSQFNKLLEKLQRAIAEIGSSTHKLNDASNDVASLIQDSSVTIVRQQNEIQTVATSMTEVAASIEEVARNAATVAEITSAAESKATTGKQVVNDTVQTIHRLHDGIHNANQVIQALKSATDEIKEILVVVGGIADQTNLLALNAAIEAARAGEMGRGFAVVADEVRTLASRTQNSIAEIESRIKNLVENAARAALVMEQSQQNAESGLETVSRAGASLDEIHRSVEAINSMITQIASATEEQAVTVKEVDKNLITIGDTGKSTTENIQHISSQAVSFNELAGGLRLVLGQFKI